ncbi:hypothetical protein B0I18_101281 [Taibaiella chishuiensis]|uniref:Uncharacterized protein n=1 Tax=Taibaiella chishuiensis TaxID=1434707 RepID=A0A2P8DA80_9BACT|nr:hypothetical protein B0I18_101281 [Taibaiella chishuiensis]
MPGKGALCNMGLACDEFHYNHLAPTKPLSTQATPFIKRRMPLQGKGIRY